ncbi:hypothetical protein C5B91_08375 [Haloferax sp. Atlit-10N]|uniref:DUF8103 domain-containing protein n=1 Tax=Haloferax prahovense (strain DSM 18310 / JCM 13924 / TL6) TaxID=1227461 RepID=M0G0R8_HALPT|nr:MULTISPECIES: hypothetical protein [Haloferax]ELZ65102.1 hypothetical protein C457_16412 [Haloferax prahovense DSM 18310]RDZ44989.1 hypothetical protein C5B87_12595 [Haloferax sp. Atlit-16N]RDZ48341.1 hypothetical protein C5B86_04660 [Haloferax sp. Atlit-19N]RDZ59234.1 hypothetical protein C5B91_08375 [Haloferax sp. Atlit-10N]
MMAERYEGERLEFDELPDDGTVDWTITQALLAASDSTSRALESHLLQAQYHDDAGADTAATARHIDDAIDRHTRIIEDLRLARDALDHR